MQDQSAAGGAGSRWKVAFWALLALMAVFRVWLALRGHSIRHPDEIFQTIEQSHRLVFGYGIRPWEYREGLRWIGTPLLLAPPMLLARWLSLGPSFYIPLTRAALALLSLLPFPIFFTLVRRRSGPAVALLACLLPLLWPESLDFVGSTLSEALVAPVLAAALALGLIVDPQSRALTLVSLALLLLLSFSLRFHVAPAIGLTAIVALVRTGPPQRRVFLIALGLGLAGLVALNAAFGQLPFQDVWLNAYRNLADGIAVKFGTEPWWYYFDQIWTHWGWTLVPALLLVLWRIRQTWLFALSALLIVLVFSVIAHKEYRFYFPATVLFTFALGWALSDTAAQLTRRLPRPALALPILSLVVVAILLGSLAPAYGTLFAETEDNRIAAEMTAARTPGLCGLDFAIGLNVLGTPGFTYLNRDVPLGAETPSSGYAPEYPAFNEIVGPASIRANLPRTYAPLQCFSGSSSGALCLYRRPGGCSPSDTTRDPPGPEAGD